MDPVYKQKRDKIFEQVELKVAPSTEPEIEKKAPSTEPEIEKKAPSTEPEKEEEVYTSLRTEREVQNVYQQVNIQPQRRKEKIKFPGKTCLWVIILIMSSVVIIGVIITIGVYASMLHDNTNFLKMEIKELQERLNKTQENSQANQIQTLAMMQEFGANVSDKLNSLQTTTQTQLNSLFLAMNTLNTTTMAELKSLQESVQTLNSNSTTTASQLSSLQSTVNTLNTDRDTTVARLNSLQDSVSSLIISQNTATNQVSNLQSRVDTLTYQVNSSVNLYQNCIQDTRSCTTEALQTEAYYTSCQTSYLPMNVTGFYTLDMRCQYDRETGQYDAAVLGSTGNNQQYRCHCVTTNLDETSGHSQFLFPTKTCTLVVTRCPLSKRLY